MVFFISIFFFVAHIFSVQNYELSLTDWQDNLLPVLQNYTHSGLTTWFYQRKNVLPDTELHAFLQSVQSWQPELISAKPSYNGQSDDLAPYRSLTTGTTFLPKQFLRYQGSTIFEEPDKKGQPAVSGYGTGWYHSLGAYALNAQKEFLQKGNAHNIVYYAAALIENFIGRAIFGASLFVDPQLQHNNGLLVHSDQQGDSRESLMIKNFIFEAQKLYVQARYTRILYKKKDGVVQSSLTPQDTFLGYIVINEVTDSLVHVKNKNTLKVLKNSKQCAPVFFVPAKNSKINFCFSSAKNIKKDTITQKNPMTVALSFDTKSPALFTVNAFSGFSKQRTISKNLLAHNVSFDDDAIQDFFSSSHQWALVTKITQSGLSVLAVVKLNPYDFPLSFSGSTIAKTLELVNTTLLQDDLFYSQKLIWNAPKNLYKKSFPDATFKTYSFSHLIVQGIFNGYLMSNTYSTFFSTQEWPQNASYSQAYKQYYTLPSNLSGFIGLDQVFPTPAASDWLGKHSSLDWFYLRALMATRLILQSVYCPYDALVIPVRYALNEQGRYKKISGTQKNMSVLEYLCQHPEETITIKMSNSKVTRTIYGQHYTVHASDAKNSYQWIVPAKEI